MQNKLLLLIGTSLIALSASYGAEASNRHDQTKPAAHVNQTPANKTNASVPRLTQFVAPQKGLPANDKVRSFVHPNLANKTVPSAGINHTGSGGGSGMAAAGRKEGVVDHGLTQPHNFSQSAHRRLPENTGTQTSTPSDQAHKIPPMVKTKPAPVTSTLTVPGTLNGRHDSHGPESGGRLDKITPLAGQNHPVSSAALRVIPTVRKDGLVDRAAVQSLANFHKEQGNFREIGSTHNPVQFKQSVDHLNRLVALNTFKIQPVGEGKADGNPSSKGDNSTIIVNADNQTVYVPASQLSGPDKRTIIVNGKNDRIVVVGDTGKSVEDDRKIIVNGSNDRLVEGGDRANGGQGQNGGSIADNRQVTLNGNRDSVTAGGDSANGGKGGNGFNGQNGGAGGTVSDNRKVTVDGNGDRVTSGTDTANGGKGGNGVFGGGNGGDGGGITDHRTVNDNGNGTSVTKGGDTANGGKGGSGLF